MSGFSPASTPSPAPTVNVALDIDQWSDHLAEETRRGLCDNPPWIPPVWFYDEAGSELFDRITRLDVYYPTRAERAILTDHATEIAQRSKAETLIELGSGTSDKTRLLLEAMTDAGTLRRFVGFDVSEEVLRVAAGTIASAWPDLDVRAVVGDFHQHLGELPDGEHRVIAFLGSTIGNLGPERRHHFLAGVAEALGSSDRLLLGTDLVKDPARLEAAYDDAQGVTAAFNHNALVVMNRELGADWDPSAYAHVSHWNAAESRIEVRLVAETDQVVSIPGLGDLEVRIAAGEWLCTEISSKFTLDGLGDELAAAGLVAEATWTDPDDDFALTLAAPAG